MSAKLGARKKKKHVYIFLLFLQEKKKNTCNFFYYSLSSTAAVSKVLVPGVDVSDVRLHHVLHQLFERDFRDPSQLVLRLSAVAL